MLKIKVILKGRVKIMKKNLKKVAVVITIVSVLGVAGAAFAVTVKTPADIASELTGKTVEELRNERVAGKTYGAIANETDKLEEFKAQILEQRKALLDQRVIDGTLTQEQADEIYNNLLNSIANCDGTKIGEGIGKNFSVGFGKGNGMVGKRSGAADGTGSADGKGSGYKGGQGN
jgi:hypothetical protein